MDITCQDKLIIWGHRNHNNKLWHFNLNQKDPKVKLSTNYVNYIPPKSNSEKLTIFLYGTCSSPHVYSFIKAIDRYQRTSKNTCATILVCMSYQRRNKLSSKRIAQSESKVKMVLKTEAIERT